MSEDNNNNPMTDKEVDAVLVNFRRSKFSICAAAGALILVITIWGVVTFVVINGIAEFVANYYNVPIEQMWNRE